MAAKPQSTETPEERERLLSRPFPADRRLVEDVMAQHHTLTTAKAIEHLREFGGL
jgi:hypothetical protein